MQAISSLLFRMHLTYQEHQIFELELLHFISPMHHGVIEEEKIDWKSSKWSHWRPFTLDRSSIANGERVLACNAVSAASKNSKWQSKMWEGSGGRPSQIDKQMVHTIILHTKKPTLDVPQCMREKSYRKSWQSYLRTSEEQLETCLTSCSDNDFDSQHIGKDAILSNDGKLPSRLFLSENASVTRH